MEPMNCSGASCERGIWVISYGLPTGNRLLRHQNPHGHAASCDRGIWVISYGLPTGNRLVRHPNPHGTRPPVDLKWPSIIQWRIMTPVLTSHPKKEKEDEGERERAIETEWDTEGERQRETMPYCLIRVSVIWSLKSYTFRNEPEQEKQRKKNNNNKNKTKKKKKKKKNGLTMKTPSSLNRILDSMCAYNG